METKNWIIGIGIFVLIVASLLVLDYSGKINIIWTSKEVIGMDLIECGNGYEILQKADGNSGAIRYSGKILCDNNRKLKDQISYEITEGHVIQRGFNRAIWYRPYFERHGIKYTFAQAKAIFPNLNIDPFKKDLEYTTGYGVDISGLDSNPNLKYNITLQGVKLENLTLEDIFIDEENKEVIYYGKYKDDFTGWFKVNESNFFLNANDKTLKFACVGNCYIDPTLTLSATNNFVEGTGTLQGTPDTNFYEVYWDLDGEPNAQRDLVFWINLSVNITHLDTITSVNFSIRFENSGTSVGAAQGTAELHVCGHKWTKGEEGNLTWNKEHNTSFNCGKTASTKAVESVTSQATNTTALEFIDSTTGDGIVLAIQNALFNGTFTGMVNFSTEHADYLSDHLSNRAGDNPWIFTLGYLLSNNISILYTPSANETSVYTNTSLRFNTTVFDANSGDKMNITGTLFVNNTGVYNITYATDLANNTEQNFTIDSGNYSARDTIIFQVNATDGRNVSLYYNSTEITVMGTTNTAIILTLDGISANRIYEYETTANITVSGDEDASICINFSAPDYGTNYTCNIPANISYKVGLAVRNVFNDSETHKNITTSGLVQVNLTDTTVDFASFNLTGFDSGGLPENISIDILNNGTVDIIIPNKINDTFVQQNIFTNGRYNETMTYARSGSKQRYLNYSVNDFGLLRIQNITLNLTGGASMNENLTFNEYFHNSTYINLTASNVTNEWTWEDFSIGDISGRWSGTYTVTTGTKVRGAFTDASRECSTGTTSDSNEFYSQTINITGYGYVKMRVYMRAGAGADSDEQDVGEVYGEGHADVDLRLKDKTTGTTTVLKTLHAGAAAGGYCDVDSDAQSDNSTWEFRKIPSKGIIEVYNDDVYSTEINYDPDHQYEVYIYGYADATGDTCSGCQCGQGNHCGGEGEAYGEIYWINASGITGRKIGNYTWENSTVFSKSMANFSTNVTAATLTATTSIPTNTDIQFFLSPDNGSTWEEVTSGLGHVFTAQGSNMTWRADLNTTGAEDSGDYSTIPIIYDVEVMVSSGLPTNITVDVGYDGTIDWNHTGELAADASTIVNLGSDTIESYILDNCLGDLVCKVPVSIYTATAGTLIYSNITANTEIHGVGLNHTMMTTNLSGCTGNNCQIIINVSASSGKVQVSGVDFRYIGEETYTIFAFDSTDRSVNATLSLTTRYSPFNVSLPPNVPGFYLTSITNLTQDGVTPFGQTIEWCNDDNHTQGICENRSMPIFNITNLANLESIDIYIHLNETWPCINITIDDDVNRSGETLLNTTYQKIISDIAIDGWNGTWVWANLTVCDVSSLVHYAPIFNFTSLCSSCVVTYDAL